MFQNCSHNLGGSCDATKDFLAGGGCGGGAVTGPTVSLTDSIFLDCYLLEPPTPFTTLSEHNPFLSAVFASNVSVLRSNFSCQKGGAAVAVDLQANVNDSLFEYCEGAVSGLGSYFNILLIAVVRNSTFNHCVITGNVPISYSPGSSFEAGGAIRAHHATVVGGRFSHCSVGFGSGGAIFGSSVDVTDSTFENCSAAGSH